MSVILLHYQDPWVLTVASSNAICLEAYNITATQTAMFVNNSNIIYGQYVKDTPLILYFLFDLLFQAAISPLVRAFSTQTARSTHGTTTP